MDYPIQSTQKKKSMTQKKDTTDSEKKDQMPSAEEVARELGKAKSIDDFYGKDGIFARLFSDTI